MKKLLILLALLGACNSDFKKLPGEDLALDLVWNQTYRMADYGHPDIAWVDAPDLNCANGKGFKIGRVYQAVQADNCVLGVTWEDWGIIQVALPADFHFSDGVFAHELWHASLGTRDGGDGDPNHKDPGFGTHFGYPYGIVDAADDLVKANGL